MVTSHCPDCNIRHAPDFHKPKKARKALFKVDEEVYAARMLRHTGLEVFTGEKGKVILAPKGGRLFIQFQKASGWVEQDNLYKE